MHDKRLSIVGLCAILACPSDHIPEVVKSGWAQLGVAFSNLFESWPDAVAGREGIGPRILWTVRPDNKRLQLLEREQLRKMHENESDDEDDEKAESEGGDEEEVEEDASEEGDVHDEGDEYLDFLASKVILARHGIVSGFGLISVPVRQRPLKTATTMTMMVRSEAGTPSSRKTFISRRRLILLIPTKLSQLSFLVSIAGSSGFRSTFYARIFRFVAPRTRAISGAYDVLNGRTSEDVTGSDL